MEFVIWGAGERGKRILYHLGNERVRAFIDNDKKKVGKIFASKEIINIENYKKNYAECIVVVSCLNENEVVKVLEDNDINNYYRLSECPGELQEPYPKSVLKKYILGYICSDKKYAIEGDNLYSILLGEWIKEKTKVLPKYICEDEIEKLEKLSVEIDEILVTSRNSERVVKKYKTCGIQITDVFDCSDKIEDYYNKEIEKFKNIHDGEICFIVATGPSLREEDLECLRKRNIKSISVNRIINAFQNVDWRPDYYLIADSKLLSEIEEQIENIEVPYLFIGDTFPAYWNKEHAANHIMFHVAYETSQNEYPKFSENFSRKCYGGYTVTYCAIQLAIYMGFKDIYLLGVDCNYIKGSKNNYFFKYDKIDNVNHMEEGMIKAYISAKQYADAHGIKIYNATRGGMLEVFERVDFDSLF